MDTRSKEMIRWGKSLRAFHLPRWKELPTIDLYKDQVIFYVEESLSLLQHQEKILTSAMINNYVKLGIVPPPKGKRYQREHLAYFIAICVLKQVFTTSEISNGILLQTKVSGLHRAYNIFCKEFENALQVVGAQAGVGELIPVLGEQIPAQNLALQMAALSVATKIYTQKVLTFPPPEKRERTINEKRNVDV